MGKVHSCKNMATKFLVVICAGFSWQVQSANLKEKIPIELQELAEDINLLDGDLQREKRDREAKPSEELIKQYYVETCSEYAVDLATAMDDLPSCKAPPFRLPTRSDVKVREEYNAFATRMKQMVGGRAWGKNPTDDQDAGYSCSFERAHHRIQARETMESNGDRDAAEDLRKRDCKCYGDPDGPCGQFVVGQEGPSAGFKRCVDDFYSGKASNPQKTCESAARTNFWVDLWCKTWGWIYFGTDLLMGGDTSKQRTAR